LDEAKRLNKDSSKKECFTLDVLLLMFVIVNNKYLPTLTLVEEKSKLDQMKIQLKKNVLDWMSYNMVANVNIKYEY
jgi:hypothetical protein